MFPTAALMAVLPVDTPDARPAGEMPATLVVDEFHVAVEVKSMVLPSLYVPKAPNCCDELSASVPFAGFKVIDTSDGAVTVRLLVPQTGPAHALNAAVPPPRAKAVPGLVASPVTVIMLEFVELQLTETSCWVLLSLNVPGGNELLDGV